MSSDYLHVDRADDPRRHPRHHVRHDPAPRDGRGPRPAVPRVGGGQRDPQGRPARRRGRRCSSSGPWASARSSSCSTASASSAPRNDVRRSAIGKLRQSFVRLGLTERPSKIAGGRHHHASRRPAVTPAYLGVGYIIGPELGALNFAGGLLAWGLFVPLLVFFLGPDADRPVHRPRTAATRQRRGPRMVGAPVPLHRPADRGRRHARRRLLHALQDAQEPDRSASSAASPTSRSRPRPQRRPSAPSRTCRFKVVGLGIAVAVRADGRALLLLHRQSIGAARRRGRRHADHRVLLRGRLGQPGRHDRLVEQPDLGPDAGHD